MAGINYNAVEKLETLDETLSCSATGIRHRIIKAINLIQKALRDDVRVNGWFRIIEDET